MYAIANALVARLFSTVDVILVKSYYSKAGKGPPAVRRLVSGLHDENVAAAEAAELRAACAAKARFLFASSRSFSRRDNLAIVRL